MMELWVNKTPIRSQKELDRFFENAWWDCTWELDLSGNGLEELDMDLVVNIHVLKSLRKLDLSGNRFATVPGYFSDLVSSMEIDLAGNPLIDPPPEIIQGGINSLRQYLLQPLSKKILAAIFIEAGRRSVRVLDLSDRKITSIPPEIGRATGLEVLKLNNNRLQSLPSQLGTLKRLKRIELLDNRFTKVPRVLLSLSGLRSLDLDSNRLTRIPDLSALSDLRNLSLCANELDSLPEALGKLSKLRVLNVMFNRLTQLPNSISKLKNLRELMLDFNRIDQLPQSITQLKRLRTLSLFENCLTCLPEDFDDLSELSDLDLRGNDLYDGFKYYDFFRSIKAML